MTDSPWAKPAFGVEDVLVGGGHGHDRQPIPWAAQGRPAPHVKTGRGVLRDPPEPPTSRVSAVAMLCGEETAVGNSGGRRKSGSKVRFTGLTQNSQVDPAV